MKKLLLALLFFAGADLLAAPNPVLWTYSAKKTGDKTYELKFVATVSAPWHIYSQYTPAGGPAPTVITMAKNPLLLSVGGAFKEEGKLVEKYEEVFGIKIKYFNGNVVFTRKIQLRANVKTILTGTVEYMACDDTQCLPPMSVPFSVKLN
ncbi:MAG TPA: protein-disulfide reductase DsbD domain-containing protein [Sediminibacterium sp.]|nr:protein-disulfide reductase DsbD domain-containing protein [Sediminibacterium sp.]